MNKWGHRSVGVFSPQLIRLVACVLLIALLPVAAGCYGSFPITHAIYKFNGAITGLGIVHTIVFWAFVIIPVYWIGLLGDVIVLNLIEFWTGEPTTASSQTFPDGTRTALEPSADGKEATLTVSRDGTVLQQMRFVRISDRELQVYDEAGQRVGGILRTASSGLILTDVHGAIVGTIGADEISQFRKAMDTFQPVPALATADAR